MGLYNDRGKIILPPFRNNCLIVDALLKMRWSIIATVTMETSTILCILEILNFKPFFVIFWCLPTPGWQIMHDKLAIEPNIYEQFFYLEYVKNNSKNKSLWFSRYSKKKCQKKIIKIFQWSIKQWYSHDDLQITRNHKKLHMKTFKENEII